MNEYYPSDVHESIELDYNTTDVYSLLVLLTGTLLDYLSTILFVNLPHIKESNPVVSFMLQHPPLFLLSKLLIVGFLLYIHYDATQKNKDEYVRRFFQITAVSIGLLWLCVGLNNVYIVFF